MIIHCANKEEWLNQREQFITATDMAGYLFPYGKAYQKIKTEKEDLCREFIGGIPKVGLLLEPLIVEQVIESLSSNGSFATLKSTSDEWTIYTDNEQKYSCSIDAIIDVNDERCIIECKSKYFDKDCNLNLRYLVQASMQAVILDVEKVFVAVYSIISDAIRVFTITKEQAQRVFDIVKDTYNTVGDCLQGENISSVISKDSTMNKYITIESGVMASNEIVELGICKLKDYTNKLKKLADEQRSIEF